MIDSSEQKTLIAHRTSCIRSLFDILSNFLSFCRSVFLLVCFLVVIVINEVSSVVNAINEIISVLWNTNKTLNEVFTFSGGGSIGHN